MDNIKSPYKGNSGSNASDRGNKVWKIIVLRACSAKKMIMWPNRPWV